MVIAQQRKAIVDGLAESITELREANVGMTEEQIMSILLTNQYLDTLNTFASKGNQTIFLPNTPNGVDDIRTQILSALRAEKKILFENLFKPRQRRLAVLKYILRLVS